MRIFQAESQYSITGQESRMNYFIFFQSISTIAHVVLGLPQQAIHSTFHMNHNSSVQFTANVHNHNMAPAFDIGTMMGLPATTTTTTTTPPLNYAPRGFPRYFPETTTRTEEARESSEEVQTPRTRSLRG